MQQFSFAVLLHKRRGCAVCPLGWRPLRNGYGGDPSAGGVQKGGSIIRYNSVIMHHNAGCHRGLLKKLCKKPPSNPITHSKWARK